MSHSEQQEHPAAVKGHRVDVVVTTSEGYSVRCESSLSLAVPFGQEGRRHVMGRIAELLETAEQFDPSEYERESSFSFKKGLS